MTETDAIPKRSVVGLFLSINGIAIYWGKTRSRKFRLEIHEDHL